MSMLFLIYKTLFYDCNYKLLQIFYEGKKLNLYHYHLIIKTKSKFRPKPLEPKLRFVSKLRKSDEIKFYEH